MTDPPPRPPASAQIAVGGSGPRSPATGIDSKTLRSAWRLISSAAKGSRLQGLLLAGERGKAAAKAVTAHAASRAVLPCPKTHGAPVRCGTTLGRVPDALFAHPRLARVYDPLDPDRSDLDTYVDLVHEFGGTSVLDVGSGTGTLACRLAASGAEVLGVDPAGASVEVARTKACADRVEWVVGTAPDVAADPARRQRYDLATMSANVAQVFLDDDEWLATLRAVRDCLRPGGHLAFETRVPADRAWERWTKELTHQVVDVPGEGPVEDWVQVTAVDGELVTFDSPTIFLADGERIESTSTLRFRTEEALRRSLADAGFVDVDVRDLPYAPGRGWLILARA